ncbi:hypothetical protein BJQ90_00519 [Arthrobacter sp. SO3]|nr:hypothetical protein [Arthrobacter sp. SO3]
MSALSPEETVLRVSTARNEPVILKLEGGAAVTLRVEVDSNCTCNAGSTPRAGSYIDRDLTLA